MNFRMERSMNRERKSIHNTNKYGFCGNFTFENVGIAGVLLDYYYYRWYNSIVLFLLPFYVYIFWTVNYEPSTLPSCYVCAVGDNIPLLSIRMFTSRYTNEFYHGEVTHPCEISFKFKTTSCVWSFDLRHLSCCYSTQSGTMCER